MIPRVPKTRAYYEQLPQAKRFDLRLSACPDFAQQCLAYYNHSKSLSAAQPEQDAVVFYALNHLAAVIRERFTPNELLPDWADAVLAEYANTVCKQGSRLLYYLVLITTRESRHIKNLSTVGGVVTKLHGPAIAEFTKQILSTSSLDAAYHFMSAPPSASLGDYLKSLVYYFNTGTFSASFGGPPWGTVAATVSSFIHGNTSMEMMVDTAYTLAHNNGPIFNKGMLYKNYQNKDFFIELLDIQRSGQMVEFVIGTATSFPSVPPELRSIIYKAVTNLPNVFGTFVDYKKVQAAGAVKSYNHKIKQQEIVPPVKKPAAKPPVKSSEVPCAAAPPSLEIFPGEFVPITTRLKTKETA